MAIYVDATPLYDLGQIGELELLEVFDGEIVIPQAVIDEITVEPAATNLARFLEENDVETEPGTARCLDDAERLLDEPTETSDAALIACLLAARDRGDTAAFVSDDRRLRAVADGLGATVTGTFGVTTRAAVDSKYFPATQAKRVIRRTDHHGVQMTGQLRERAIGEVDG
ncbi:MAG: putative nucleic acid-binding protein [Natronomonas sp.]|jgi:predicted nucleic acid-binding protein